MHSFHVRIINLYFDNNCAKTLLDTLDYKFCTSSHNFVLFAKFRLPFKGQKKILRKSCSSSVPKMLFKLTPGGFHSGKGQCSNVVAALDNVVIVIFLSQACKRGLHLAIG